MVLRWPAVARIRTSLPPCLLVAITFARPNEPAFLAATRYHVPRAKTGRPLAIAIAALTVAENTLALALAAFALSDATVPARVSASKRRVAHILIEVDPCAG
jgi:hypothetical protein